jgi:anti-anti-sigma factor
MNMTNGRVVAVKALPEKLGAGQGSVFFREVEACLTADRPCVVLDFSKVRQLDNDGIQVLLRCLEEAMKRNGDVKLAAIPPGVAKALELTGVQRLFEVFDNAAHAVNSFHQLTVNRFQQAPERECSIVTPKVRRSSLEDSQSDSRQQPPVSRVTIKTSGSWLRRQIAGCLLLLLVVPLAAAAPPQQEANLGQEARDGSSVQAQSQDSKSGSKKADTEQSPHDALPNSPSTVRLQTIDHNQLSSLQQTSLKQQDDTKEPLGAAAAPPVKTTGVAASKPAGAAIAPAKQRRARSMLIKVAAIAGAGVAIGAVVALSSASPSRPH